jgi:hypothetical protein
MIFLASCTSPEVMVAVVRTTRQPVREAQLVLQHVIRLEARLGSVQLGTRLVQGHLHSCPGVSHVLASIGVEAHVASQQHAITTLFANHSHGRAVVAEEEASLGTISSLPTRPIFATIVERDVRIGVGSFEEIHGIATVGANLSLCHLELIFLASWVEICVPQIQLDCTD